MFALKYGTLSPDAQHTLRVRYHDLVYSTGFRNGKDKMISGACWPAAPAEFGELGCIEKTCLKKKKVGNKQDIILTSAFHPMHMHYKHTATHTRYINANRAHTSKNVRREG